MPASRTYDVVLTWLETGLRTGQLRVGQRLPSERSLAERFGISRGSVREAIRELDAMGLVRSGVGSGPNAGPMRSPRRARASRPRRPPRPLPQPPPRGWHR